MDKKLCTRCSTREAVCRFEAIRGFKVAPIAREGYAFFSRVCPKHCIKVPATMAQRL